MATTLEIDENEENESEYDEDDEVTELDPMDMEKEISLWNQAIGGVKEGQIYGLGSVGTSMVSKCNASTAHTTLDEEDYINHEISRNVEQIKLEIEQRVETEV